MSAATDPEPDLIKLGPSAQIFLELPKSKNILEKIIIMLIVKKKKVCVKSVKYLSQNS
jgi:hypothetical protein